MNDKNLRLFDNSHFWHPYTQMKFYRKIKPPIIVRGEGNYLYDTKGKKYLDAISSVWCITFGHSHPHIKRKIKKQIDKLQHCTTLGLANIPSIILSKKLSEISGFQKVFLSEDGAEAVEVAMKLSFSFFHRRNCSTWNNPEYKSRFLSVEGAYHGDTIGCSSLGRSIFSEEWSPLYIKNYFGPSINCYRCSYNKGTNYKDRLCSLQCLEGMLKIMKKNTDQICAVFLEGGIQGAGGMCPYPDVYLREVYKESKKSGILFVLDEVASGFGRALSNYNRCSTWNNFFVYQEEKIKPDIVCIGKGLSGGYIPISATLTDNKIYNLFYGEQFALKHFFYGHTFSGNPLLSTSAIANIELFQKGNLLKNLESRVGYFWKKAESLYNTGIVGDVRGRGLMMGIELVKNPDRKESFPVKELAGWRICLSMLKKGVLLRPLGDIITVVPPLTITEAEIDYIFDNLYSTIIAFRKKKKI